MQLPKYSMGIGDRFGRQGQAQLQAFLQAHETGIDVTPVWNKSHREHSITGTTPESVRDEADAAVNALGWDAPYFVDADHIRLETVYRYIPSSDFFTIDVADKIGPAFPAEDLDIEIESPTTKIALPGVDTPIEIDTSDPARIVHYYGSAITEAARIYESIDIRKGTNEFIVEVSMDETDSRQTPVDLLLILQLIRKRGFPIHTIAPKFTGRFNKGVDYAGDLDEFEQGFEQIVGVIRYAIDELGHSSDLKLSVHTGSDKFSLYPIMRRILQKHDVGIHLKTAGTTWLEEAASLAQASEDGWNIIREIYTTAYETRQELCGPYAAVIDIDDTHLPTPADIDRNRFTSTIRHDPTDPEYNPNARQLMHLAFKIAAQMGSRFTDALDKHAEVIAPHVTENLLERHIKPLFPPS